MMDSAVHLANRACGRAGGFRAFEGAGAIVTIKALCRVLTACSCCAEQKNAIAVAHCKRGKGVLNVNGYPIDGLLPESMRYKVFEPVLLIGNDKFKEVDIRVKVRGGGNTSQIFGALQSFCDACAVIRRPAKICRLRANLGVWGESGGRVTVRRL